LGLDLIVQSLVTASSVGSPSISQVHEIAPDAIITASIVTSADLTQVHVLVVDNLLTASEILGASVEVPVLFEDLLAYGLHDRNLIAVGLHVPRSELVAYGLHDRQLIAVGVHDNA
jgi:hypothetical protein